MKFINFFIYLVFLFSQTYAVASTKNEKELKPFSVEAHEKLKQYLVEEAQDNEALFSAYKVKLTDSVFNGEEESLNNEAYIEYAGLPSLLASCVKVVTNASMAVYLATALLVNTCKKYISTYKNRGVDQKGYIRVPLEVYRFNIKTLREIEQEIHLQCFADSRNAEAPVCK